MVHVLHEKNLITMLMKKMTNTVRIKIRTRKTYLRVQEAELHEINLIYIRVNKAD